MTPATPPPPAVDQIVAVVFGPAANQVTATCGAPIFFVDNPPLAMWLFEDGGDPIPATATEVIDPNHVVLTFGVDVSAALEWHVEDPGVWQFVDGGPMVEPLDGEMS